MAGLITIPQAPSYVDKVKLPTAMTPAQVTAAPPTFQAAAAPTAPSANTLRTITGNETVQGQLNNIIKADSPLMQSAAGTANAASNSRGLINSSLGVGAAQKAVIDSALPIAQQDAQTHANSGMSAQEANQNLKQTGYQGTLQRGLSAQEANQEIGKIGFQGVQNRTLSAQETNQQAILNAQNADLQSAQGKENYGYNYLGNEQQIKAAEALQTQKTAADLALAVQGDQSAMERLKAQAAADSDRAAKGDKAAFERLLAQGKLDSDRAAQGDTAAMTRLMAQIKGDTDRAAAGDQSAMKRLETQLASDNARAAAGDQAAMARLQEQGKLTSSLQTQQDAGKMAVTKYLNENVSAEKLQALSSTEKIALSSAIYPLFQQMDNSIKEIQLSPDMDAAGKATAIAEAQEQTYASADALASLFGAVVTW